MLLSLQAGNRRGDCSWSTSILILEIWNVECNVENVDCGED